MSPLAKILRDLAYVDEKKRKILEAIDRMEAVLERYDKKLLCLDGDECAVETRLDTVRVLSRWHDVLKYIENNKNLPRYMLDIKTNYSEGRVERICLQGDPHECIDIDAKLPLSDQDIEKIRGLIRERIRMHLEAAPYKFYRYITALMYMIDDILNDLNSIRRDIDNMDRVIRSILSRINEVCLGGE